MVLVFEVFWPPDAWSADHWVGPKGRDGDNLGTRGRPWATLQYAADRVRPGDTVHVLDGDYSGFDLRRGGSQQASVGFKAEGKRVRIVRRNQKTPDGINVEQAGFVVIDGFTVNAMPRACGEQVLRTSRSRKCAPITTVCGGSLQHFAMTSSSLRTRPQIRSKNTESM